jgi:hypothetical protein
VTTDDPRGPTPPQGGGGAQQPPSAGGPWGHGAPPPPGEGPATVPGAGGGGAQPTETLVAGDPGGGGRRRWVVPTVVGVVLLLLGGVAVAVAATLRGGGTQPEEVVPGDALAFAKLDLDPSAGQKVAALRFMRQFPQLEDAAEGKDLRRSLFEALADEGELDGVDYARDVEPWLGQRVAVAALPPAQGEEEPGALVAVQVTDEEAAREGIGALAEASDEEAPGVVVRDGYALVAEDQKAADAAASAAEEGALAEREQYRSDMDAIGETGVSSGWFDLDGLATVVADTDPQASALLGDSAQFSGRVGYAVRFDGDDLEAVATTQGMKSVRPVSGPRDNGLARLPESTVAAFGLANGDQLLTRGWDQALSANEGTPAGRQLEALVAQAQAFGFALPQDLATLFGSSFALAVDAQGVGGGGTPKVGARVTTDTAKAEAVLDKLEGLVGLGSVVSREPTDDGVVVASDPSYARTLASGGSLGETEGFRAALPGVGEADFAAWADLDRLASALGPQAADREARETMAQVDGFGVTGSIEGKGEARYTVRVVTR